MKKQDISREDQKEIIERIYNFNQKYFRGQTEKLSYFAEFKGKYIYLKRKEYSNISPVARLTYTGNINELGFAIFKWSSESYDPDEWFFPGEEHLDGTIEGAMKAGLEAYPV